MKVNEIPQKLMRFYEISWYILILPFSFYVLQQLWLLVLSKVDPKILVSFRLI
jgi:hypothetical protein